MRLIRQIIKFEAKSWIALLVITGVATLGASLFGSFSTKTFTMPNKSMAPTIEKNELITVDMRAYEIDDPNTGDLAIFIPNESSDLRWIFRVAGVPGDSLAYVNGVLHRNGKPIQTPAPLQNQTFKSPDRMKVGAEITYPHQLGKSEYFFLSDDPSHLHDSRYWGIVVREQILGRITSHN